jgi:hypothetical protein
MPLLISESDSGSGRRYHDQEPEAVADDPPEQAATVLLTPGRAPTTAGRYQWGHVMHPESSVPSSLCSDPETASFLLSDTNPIFLSRAEEDQILSQSEVPIIANIHPL